MSNLQQTLEDLKQYDTPTITNIIATLPHDQVHCLGLYNPWAVNWYTDERLRCIFPEHGRRAGYVVTVVYGMPDPSFDRLQFIDVLRAVEQSPKPVILAVKQDFPEHIKRKNGLLGGNMMTAYHSLGVTGVLTDGPSRDVDEIRPLGIQCLFTGVTAGHGKFAIQAVNVPVEICGMDVAPGDMVHMDENGAVKFPAAHLSEINARAAMLAGAEAAMQAAMRETTDPEELWRLIRGVRD